MEKKTQPIPLFGTVMCDRRWEDSGEGLGVNGCPTGADEERVEIPAETLTSAQRVSLSQLEFEKLGVTAAGRLDSSFD